MKRFLLLALVIAALGVALVPVALAQGTTPAQPGTGCPMGGFGMGGSRGGRMMGADGTMMAGVAELLELSVEEIHAQRLAGESLAQIAEAQGVDRATLVEALLDTRQTALDALVKDGRLTRAQADAMIEHMTGMVETMVDSTDAGPMWENGGQRGHMGMRGSQRGGQRQGLGMRSQIF
jgi:hypothetical protein